MTEIKKTPSIGKYPDNSKWLTRRALFWKMRDIAFFTWLAAIWISSLAPKAEASIKKISTNERKLLDRLFTRKYPSIDWYPAPWSVLNERVKYYRIKSESANEEKELIQAFERMFPYLSMINSKCNKYRVPLEIAFTAIVESRWQAWVCSNKWACWYWQISEYMAEKYGIRKVENWKVPYDYRDHPEKSSDVAIHMIRDNYKIVWNWESDLYREPYKKKSEARRLTKIENNKLIEAGKLNEVKKLKTNKELLNEVKKEFEINNHDRWHFALYCYNWWSKLVKPIYVELQWKSKNYSLSKIIGTENRLFVAKIFAVRKILSDHFQNDILSSKAYTTHHDEWRAALNKVEPKKRPKKPETQITMKWEIWHMWEWDNWQWWPIMTTSLDTWSNRAINARKRKKQARTQKQPSWVTIRDSSIKNKLKHWFQKKIKNN